MKPQIPPERAALLTSFTALPTNEDLLATALNAVTQFRLEFAKRPGVDLAAPVLARAIADATSKAFSIRELAQWLLDNGVPASVTQLHRIAKATRNPGEPPFSQDFFQNAYFRIEEAAKWILQKHKIEPGAAGVFNHAFLGTPVPPRTPLHHAFELTHPEPGTVKSAAQALAEQFVAATQGRPIVPGEMQHYEVMRELATMPNEMIRGILDFARELNQIRPPAQ